MGGRRGFWGLPRVLAGLLALLVGAAAPVGAGADDIGPLNGTSTTTTSTTHHTTFTRVDLPDAEAFATRVAVVVDGQAVFDQTVGDAPDSAPAQVLLGQAAGVLAGLCAPMGPFTSNTDLQGPPVHLGDAFVLDETSVTTTTTFGPATILIGPDQSQTFFVPAGTLNVNTNTHTESFFDQQFQATVTHRTDLVFTAESCAAPHGVPDPPTNVTAVLGSIVVSWTPPTNPGTSPISSYVVTASPGGQTYSVDGSTTTLRIENPAPGGYTFTVRAVNASGSSLESAPSNSVTVVAVGGAATPVVATPRTAG